MSRLTAWTVRCPLPLWSRPRCSTEAKALFVDGGIVSRKRLACFPLQQMYLIALKAGLQRLEKNFEGEILVVPRLEWAIR